VLVIPGLGGSGPDHWQTRWERKFPRHVRVEQSDWDHPERETWLKSLAAAIEAAAGERPVLVAHSLGCAVVAHAARRWPSLPVRASLLVAPADVDSPAHTPPETRGFSPLPLSPLPWAATVLASQNDPFVSIERARTFAEAWGAAFVDVGRLGHINALSNLGDWDDGRHHLNALMLRAEAP
jgi:uncharacterized protein